MREFVLSDDAPIGIDDAGMMLLRSPINTCEPSNRLLCHDISLQYNATGHQRRLPFPGLALNGATSYWDPSSPTHRGACPQQVLVALEEYGSSRRVGPPGQLTIRTNQEVSLVQGGVPGQHRQADAEPRVVRSGLIAGSPLGHAVMPRQREPSNILKKFPHRQGRDRTGEQHRACHDRGLVR